MQAFSFSETEISAFGYFDIYFSLKENMYLLQEIICIKLIFFLVLGMKELTVGTNFTKYLCPRVDRVQ